MLSHALTIVLNELEAHLTATYGAGAVTPQVRLGNVAEGVGSSASNTGSVPRDVLAFSVVNVREEKTLKNVPAYVRNDANLTVRYQNPPVYLNLHLLAVATHSGYANALLVMSRALRFFQARNVFEQDSVAPASITTNAPTNPLDQLATFKLIFDLYSPTMEEVNHMWGTLGGKQYPFFMYTVRMLELTLKSIQAESGVITEIVDNFRDTSSAVV